MRVKGRVLYNTVPNLFSVVVNLVAYTFLITSSCGNTKKERLPSRSARCLHYVVKLTVWLAVQLIKQYRVSVIPVGRVGVSASRLYKATVFSYDTVTVYLYLLHK